MKTHRISEILRMMAISLILIIGSTAVFAQGRGHGHDNKSKKDQHSYRSEKRYDKGDKYKGDQHSYRNDRHSYRSDRGRSYHYSPSHGNDRVYYSRAPWGSRRPSIYNHSKGRLYYYRGHYYDYYPERGYFVVEAPHGYVFNEVPRGFTRVWIDNTWCYHRGDFYLRPSAHGYISFNRPGLSVGIGF